ncbi:AIG1 domain-containing protein [Rhizoctonia solani AG-1 IA]|uniref:AIG1 domain-containing protein n=1 Tax=Thanatephorus cucumeris (strain AG1-IA) TaxID=983506 RepID=L8WFN8_THACA|nr:AIG1 domain-containing protein [Rhizoctonia solani AG-1 IA]
MSSHEDKASLTYCEYRVLGRSGSGKSFVSTKLFAPEIQHSHHNTTCAKSQSAVICGHKFRFIDTPGFDNPYMSDAEVLTEIGDYFLDPRRADLRVNGILYVHQAGDTLHSRALSRVFAVLSKHFLGPAGLGRLTILVAYDNIWQADPAIVDEFHNPNSAFGDAILMGAHVEMFDPTRNGFQGALTTYIKKPSIFLPIQKSTRMSRPEFRSHMETLLGYFEAETLEFHLKARETSLRDSFDARWKQLNSEMESKNLQLDQCRRAYKESDDQYAAQVDAIAVLNQKLLQIHQEYSSLRSQLQLRENFEQSEVVQELKDLNRCIDDIGRSFSAYLTDKYVFNVFNRDISEVTALDAHNLPGLRSLLGHDNHRPSLISSAEGMGMDIEGFLDFCIRALLCTSLDAKLFSPFHPFISVEQSNALCDVYKDIREREPQTVAGKWRSNTFKSIYRSPTANDTEDKIKEIASNILNTQLDPLLTYLFGEIKSPLNVHHVEKLQELVNAAWLWNIKLKGEVIMLGDFRTTTYNANFNPIYMEEFEPDAAKPQAQYVLGTLAIGLISQRAIGGDQLPEETVDTHVCLPRRGLCCNPIKPGHASLTSIAGCVIAIKWVAVATSYNPDYSTQDLYNIRGCWYCSSESIMASSKGSVDATPKPFRGPWEGESKIIIGIDVGTTQSGVAFTFLQNGECGCLSTATSQTEPQQGGTSKIPTLVWYDAGKAVSFGAEALLTDIEEEAEDNGWFLAKHFKLHLHPDDMKAKHDLKLDDLPPGVPIRQVYTDFLGYLLKHTREYFEDRILDGKLIWERYSPDMEVVLAHPNGWGIREQTFLRKVATDAGLSVPEKAQRNIRFLSEAEASVHFCIHHTNLGNRLQPGTHFAVCDAGGSTVDTTLYSVVSLHPLLKLEEKRASACVQAGAIFVDLEAEGYLRKSLSSVGLNADEIKDYTKAGMKDFEGGAKRGFQDEIVDQHITVGNSRFNNTAIRARRGRLTLAGQVHMSYEILGSPLTIISTDLP